MRLVGRKVFSVWLSAVLVLSVEAASRASTTQKLSDLFEQLKSPPTSDQAAQRLLKLGRANATARHYLTIHLPPVIGAGPRSSSVVWLNSVKLAGNLKIGEAAPALTKWISAREEGPTTTLSWEIRLTKYPAARALVAIGNPAILALQQVLDRGDLNNRYKAVEVLNLIASKKANRALRAHLGREPDANLREFINRSLSK